MSNIPPKIVKKPEGEGEKNGNIGNQNGPDFSNVLNQTIDPSLKNATYNPETGEFSSLSDWSDCIAQMDASVVHTNFQPILSDIPYHRQWWNGKGRVESPRYTIFAGYRRHRYLVYFLDRMHITVTWYAEFSTTNTAPPEGVQACFIQCCIEKMRTDNLIFSRAELQNHEYIAWSQKYPLEIRQPLVFRHGIGKLNDPGAPASAAKKPFGYTGTEFKKR